MAVPETVSNLLSIATFVLHIFLVIFIVLFLAEKIFNKKLIFFLNTKNYLQKNSLLFSFIIALSATLFSLMYSEVMLLEPCNLCWYQRIFMYPLVVLFLVALLKKDNEIRDYALPLIMIGILTSAYQYIIQATSSIASCEGSSVPCNLVYIQELGYITIPLMSLTAFVLIFLFMVKKK